MTEIMKPMLAAKLTEAEFGYLNYPVWIQPKVDGIRVFNHPTLGPVTRSLKAVPNKRLRDWLARPDWSGYDGEVVYGEPTDPECFNRTTGYVRSMSGPIEGVRFIVFDNVTLAEQPYAERYFTISADVRIPCAVAENWREIMEHYERLLAAGWEGAMLRSPRMPYKFNRSTLKEGGLLKLKPMASDTAQIIGFEQRFRNRNAAVTNERGYTERSSHKENLEPDEALGALVVRIETGKFKGKEVNIGSGFDDTLRRTIWSGREHFRGMYVEFTHQLLGATDLPRFPIFKGFRMKEDT